MEYKVREVYGINNYQLYSILEGYLVCILFTNDILDIDSIYDINIKCRINAMIDIIQFINSCKVESIKAAISEYGAEQLGHDFWYERAGEGAGFFDRGYESDIEKDLKDNANKFKGVDVYIDNNMLCW